MDDDALEALAPQGSCRGFVDIPAYESPLANCFKLLRAREKVGDTGHMPA
jgi:hypothetical protein